MDDKEYYTLMNRSNSEIIIKNLLKKQNKEIGIKKYQILESRQGREDKEMLHEKKGDFRNED